MNTKLERVGAESVAKFLGVDKTTVYALVKGVRGWRQIEPLPHHIRTSNPVRDRLEFDLNEVVEWKNRTRFEVKPSGRRLVTRRVKLEEATA